MALSTIQCVRTLIKSLQVCRTVASTSMLAASAARPKLSCEGHDTAGRVYSKTKVSRALTWLWFSVHSLEHVLSRP